MGKKDCCKQKSFRSSEDSLAFAIFFSILTPPFLPGKLLPGPSPPQQSQPFLPRGLLHFPHSLLLAHSSAWITMVFPQAPARQCCGHCTKEGKAIQYVTPLLSTSYTPFLLPTRDHRNYGSALLLKFISKNCNRNLQ